MNLKTLYLKYRKQLIFLLVLITALMVRLISFTSHPGGLNQDEASIGYDTWALLESGIDRNGYSFPVHFIAWGSGQNALYAYLSMPFVALFGLNVFSTRIVNLIFSVLSIIAVYSMIKKQLGFKTGIIAMTLVSVSPWNIMLSRWGLESNLFPSMFIISIWALSSALYNRKFLYLAAFLFALTMYSYGASYLVITLFIFLCGVAYIFMYIRNKSELKKQLPMKTVILSLLVFFIFATPIYLFMIINVFQLDDINIGFISIPHTYGERLSTMAGTTLKEIWNNIKNNVMMQIDGNSRNSFPFYGCIYVISLPFCIYGIIKTIRTKKPFSILLINSFISSMLLFIYYNDPNINRVNAIYMPMIIFTAIGISNLTKEKSQLAAFSISYALCFTGFLNQYFSPEYKQQVANEFYTSLDEAILKAENVCNDGENIYVTARVNMPYIYVLFYTQPSPEEFIDTVVYSNPKAQFQYVSSFGNYIFEHEYINSGQNGIYILENGDCDTIRTFTDEIYTYENYSVAVVRN